MQQRYDRERFLGQRVYVVGGGPSLIGLDLDSDLTGKPVVCCNDAYMLDCCTLCAFGDSKWGRMHEGVLAGLGRETWTNNHVGQEHPYFRYLKKSAVLSTRGDSAAWYGNTGGLGIQLALLGGASEVVLLGFDMGIVDGLTNWYVNRGNPSPGDYGQMAKQLESLAADARRLYPHRRIVNADPATSLECWDVCSPSRYGVRVPTGHAYRCT